MRSDMGPGAIFPDYALPDHTNTVRRLSELQGADPISGAEVHVLDAGHFALDEKPDEVARLTRNFLLSANT